MFDKYVVEPISAKRANELTIAKHYLHRQASSMFAYGLYDGLHLVGVIIYGKPASPALCVGVCGADESSRVIELTRLWVEDGTPKNTESFFIGKTLKMLPKNYDIIVSYAEIGAGHTGVVYQATNWIYTGLSDKHIEYRIDGESGSHSRHLLDSYGGVNKAKEVLGDRMVAVERGRKHRYIFFIGNARRRKQLLAKLRYKIQPYPKKEENNETNP